MFEKNKPTIALNTLYTKKKEIFPAYISTHNSTCEKKNKNNSINNSKRRKRRMALSSSKKIICFIKRNNMKTSW